MKSKIFVVVISLLIVLPVIYLLSNEFRYRATHPENNSSPAKADTTSIPKVDSVH